jgi:hypothetical protein
MMRAVGQSMPQTCTARSNFRGEQDLGRVIIQREECRERTPHRSKIRAYSGTSSARASTLGGIVRPSVLAVLRLITSSNLLGSITGRSASVAPLSTRPTSDLSICVGDAAAVAYQPASCDELARIMDSRQRVARR